MLALYTLISVTVLATSVLSGIFGMAGGMILMAVLVPALGVPTAMLLHGSVQAVANGSRASFLFRHIYWKVLPTYLIGASCALGFFTWLALVPPAGLVMIAIGLFPWLSLLSSKMDNLDVTRPATAFVCGIVVTAAQLLAGVSGPLLDTFYVKSRLTRQEIVATKALTQTIGHVMKIVLYGFLLSQAITLSGWLLATGMAMALLGTRIGTFLLNRWNDADFRRYSRLIILVIGTICIIQGLVTFWVGA